MFHILVSRTQWPGDDQNVATCETHFKCLLVTLDGSTSTLVGCQVTDDSKAEDCHSVSQSIKVLVPKGVLKTSYVRSVHPSQQTCPPAQLEVCLS